MIARDYESPADANTDNVYEVTLVATDDDGNTASEAFTVTVTDVVEAAVSPSMPLPIRPWLRMRPLPVCHPA